MLMMLIHERKYYFAVGTGQSKSGLIGEASIDFSSYAEANKVTLVSLPLQKSHSEAILHVSIQRIQDCIDQRDLEESDDAKLNSKDHSLRAQFVNNDEDRTTKDDSFEVEEARINQGSNQIFEPKRNRRTSSESDVTLSALSTLLDDRVNVDQSISFLSEKRAIHHVLNVVKDHREEVLWQKAFWMIEKFLIEGREDSVSNISQDKLFPATLVSAFHHADDRTRQMAEKIIRHLNRIPIYPTQ
ncbi:Armadillo/beta-catenin-like repeat family protein [Dorcoceras hygrometricum]|uniref:Armadillo/beta-catenin-like repeat family protein n=1 Tax=Dorcoceras hygrometricum TaxID=472368 RepID=A0A2Z7A0Z3_9LAMI|nr:Armadillo/beta-catenin-like repeat family protein [Dorcoceras hygrometricum]